LVSEAVKIKFGVTEVFRFSSAFIVDDVPTTTVGMTGIGVTKAGVNL
jgi:hypothetical protein